MKHSLFQLIDFDRTLFDTARFAGALTDKVNQLESGLGDTLRERMEEAYKSETTFFLLSFLREYMGDHAFEELVDEVVAELGKDAFLLPGAKERLAFASTISTLQPACGIITYGFETDQRMKIKIAGLEALPTLIVDTPDKMGLIASWKTDDGSFQLPEEFGGHIADALTLEDDKHRALLDAPDGVSGIWITTDPEAASRLDEKGYENVRIARDLFESMELLKR